MKKNMVVIHMSGAYAEQIFYKEKQEGWQICQIDCRDIEGTNCYCDDAAKESLRERVRPYSYEGIHFLDSGNYHYLSLLWLEKIKEPFSLILFDHHPDLQAPSWGGITSCGGWVREALLTNENLQRVYLVGVDAHLIEDVRAEDEASDKAGMQTFDTIGNATTGNIMSAKELWEKIQIGMPDFLQERHPIYVSFDKDVLREEDAVCDWDQGDMTLDEAVDNLHEIREKAEKILGMDICGEDARWKQTQEASSCQINDQCNRRLVEALDSAGI